VTITDLDEVVPHIQANIDANIGVHLAAERVVAAALGAVLIIWVFASLIHHSVMSCTHASCIASLFFAHHSMGPRGGMGTPASARCV
jgi:hypothetical protein